MSRWGLMDGVADLPERAFSENKFTRTFEGGGGGGGSSSGTYGAGMTPAQSQALATVSGGSTAPTALAATPSTPYTPSVMGTPNPYQQAQMAQQGALMGTVAAGTTPLGSIAGTNLAAYQNPYTTQVINAQNADIMRGAQMGLNQLGAQASAAGAFGGSRHGVAMSELGRGAAQLMGQQSAQLRQQGFMNAQQMAQQDIQNRLSQANLGLGAAQQLAGLGQQSFGYGQTINQGLAAQGQQQQALQQALIDAAKAQYAGYQGQPAASLGYASAALGATPIATQNQQTRQLGLMDYLTAAGSMAKMMPSDVRLKTNIKLTNTLENGVKTYTWDWTEEGQKLTGEKSNSGVIAQEVAELFPEAVITGDHGYMMVDYSHPELREVI